MSNDRWAAFKAQKQANASQNRSSTNPGLAPSSNGGQSLPEETRDSYEMRGIQSTSVAADDMSSFYAEISSIQDSIRTYNDNVTQIGELRSRSLGRSGPDSEITSQLDDLVAANSTLSDTLKRRIKTLETQGGSGRTGQIRMQQTALVKSKFVQAIQNYQSVELMYRNRQKERIERQFKIVKPDASPEEIKAVVNDDGGQGQIFAQALMDNRYGDAQLASREVQQRHEDIKRIERTLAELAQLFSDMSIVTEQQQENVEHIEDLAGKVEKDTEAGFVQTELAVVYARAARHKRWICFGIVVVILAVIAIALGVIFGRK